MEQIVKMFNLEQIQTVLPWPKIYYFWEQKQLFPHVLKK
jgi:hypothetical protein